MTKTIQTYSCHKCGEDTFGETLDDDMLCSVCGAEIERERIRVQEVADIKEEQ